MIVVAAQAAADQATKEWLGSAKIGIPRMVRDGDTGQIALSHADVSHLLSPPLSSLLDIVVLSRLSVVGSVRNVGVRCVWTPTEVWGNPPCISVIIPTVARSTR